MTFTTTLTYEQILAVDKLTQVSEEAYILACKRPHEINEVTKLKLQIRRALELTSNPTGKPVRPEFSIG